MVGTNEIGTSSARDRKSTHSDYSQSTRDGPSNAPMPAPTAVAVSVSTGNCNHISSSYNRHQKWPTVCRDGFTILESSNHFNGSNLALMVDGTRLAGLLPRCGPNTSGAVARVRVAGTPTRPGCVGVGHQRRTVRSPHPHGEQELSTGT